MKQTIVILGSHPRTREFYDWNRTDADVWVFNEAPSAEWLKGKPIDGVFQLHQPAIFRNPKNRNDPNHYAWLKSGNTPPLFMQEKYSDIPNAVQFPRDEVLQNIRNAVIIEDGRRHYIREVSCSPAWAVAYAIYCGYKRIEIYGVELESDTEYSYQQGSFKFWLGVAIGRGVEVELHSRMFNNPQYGYDGEIEIRYEEFTQRISSLMVEHAVLAEQYKAAGQKTAVMVAEFEKVDNSDALKATVKEQMEIGGRLAFLEGRIQANKHYIDKADEMTKAAEKFVFSRQEFEHNAKQCQINAGNSHDAYNGASGQIVITHQTVVKAAKGSPKRKKVLAQYSERLAQLITLNNTAAGWNGAADENMYYMRRLDAGVKAAGGDKSEQAIIEQRMNNNE